LEARCVQKANAQSRGGAKRAGYTTVAFLMRRETTTSKGRGTKKKVGPAASKLTGCKGLSQAVSTLREGSEIEGEGGRAKRNGISLRME